MPALLASDFTNAFDVFRIGALFFCLAAGSGIGFICAGILANHYRRNRLWWLGIPLTAAGAMLVWKFLLW